MNCDNLKKLAAIINRANADQNVNHYITQYIQSVICISSTGELEDLRKEISMSQHFLKTINDHLYGKSKTFAFDNVRFVCDIMIEDFPRWTIKKEILKVFNNGLCHQINEAGSRSITNRICRTDSSFQFYLHKLIDVLSVYGDYDFQALIIEIIFRISTTKELKIILDELIPESKELRIAFSKINVDNFDEAVRDFLNSLNQRDFRIFSIRCQKVILGPTNCEQNMDKCEGVWVDFNMVDGAVSWYTNVKTSQEVAGDSCNLITVFKDDVEKITIQRLEESVHINITLKNPCLSCHEGYQPIIDKALTVCFQLAHSTETNNLICNVLPTVFRRKTVNNNTKIDKTIDTILLKTSRKWGQKLPVRVLRKRKSSINYEIASVSTTSRSSKSYFDDVQIGIPLAEKLASDIEASKISNTIRSSILKDKNVNVPDTSTSSKSNRLKIPSLTCNSSEADFLNPFCFQNSDIDNMSMCFTSEEQLLRIANDFDAVSSIMNNMFSTEKFNSDNTSQTNRAISSTRKKVVPKHTKNRTGKLEVTTNNSPTCSLSSINKNHLLVDSDAGTLSTFKLLQILDDNNSSEQKAERIKANNIPRIFNSTVKDISNLDTSHSNNEYVSEMSKQEGHVSHKQLTIDQEEISRSPKCESIDEARQPSHETIWKEPLTAISNRRKTLEETSTQNKRKILKSKSSKSKDKLTSKKENRKTINGPTENKFKMNKITNRNYNVSCTDFNPNSSLDEVFSKLFHKPLKQTRLDKPTDPFENKNLKRRGIVAIDPIMREVIEDTESVKSVPHSLNAAATPITPPPVFHDNSVVSISSSGSSIIRKMKVSKPVPVTSFSEIQKDKMSQLTLVEENKTALGLPIVKHLSERDTVFDEIKNKKSATDGNKDDKIDQTVKKGVIKSTKNDVKVVSTAKVWSKEALTCLQPVCVDSNHFSGFYLLIVFYHFDMFLFQPKFYSEIHELNNKLQEFKRFKTRILLCCKGISMDILERADQLKDSEFENITIPLIVDDEGFMSSVFKVCLEDCECGIKSVLLLDDRGNTVAKNEYYIEYELDVDFLLKMVRHFQASRNFGNVCGK